MSTSGAVARGMPPLSYPERRDEPVSPARTRLRAAGFPLDASVLPQDLFRGALRRERKRADRFEEPFLLLVISWSGARPDRGTAKAVVAAARAVRRETDLVGWLKVDRTLGVIVPTTGGYETRSDELVSRVRRELAAGLGAESLARISIEVRIESGTTAAAIAIAHADEEIRTAAQRAIALSSRAAKRILDVAGSAALLLLTSPVFLVIAALVKLTSPGPVLFRQERVGWNGKPFRMLKFRTMLVNADSAIHQQYVTQFIRKNQAAAEGSESAFKIANDPRVTPVGRFLRKTSLDEFPQFWNVLRGEMSLVGPRPPLRYEVSQYQRWHHLRVLEAKPGITGLWQVMGRSRTTFDEMVRLDVRYARTRSLWTDIKILLATPRAVISGKGAC